METGQGGAEAEEVTAQYEEYNGKVEEDELFIVQNGEPVSPHFTRKWDTCFDFLHRLLCTWSFDHNRKLNDRRLVEDLGPALHK